MPLNRSREISCQLMKFSKRWDGTMMETAALVSAPLEGGSRRVEGCGNVECPWRTENDYYKLFEVRIERGEVVECYRVRPKFGTVKGKRMVTGACFSTDPSQQSLEYWELATDEEMRKNKRQSQEIRRRRNWQRDWRDDREPRGGAGIISL